MKRLFGTDGVRGKANEILTPSLAYALGKSACTVLKQHRDRPVFVIGKDTRLSCDMLECAIASGIMSAGGDVCLLGIIPTPAVAVLTRQLKADAGIVISASHNPFYDNGIKFFNEKGLKLADEIEDSIQKNIDENTQSPTCTDENIGRIRHIENAGEMYTDFLKKNLPPMDLTGLKVILDCANGSTYRTAEKIFTDFGADVQVVAAEPTGININDRCGSTHTEALCMNVKRTHPDMALAFDGDGDRLIAVDENGNEVDGDVIMYILAKYLKKQGKLHKNTVAATVMSNMGLAIALEKEGISTVQTPVGDRYIIQQLLKSGLNFGGEQSGHLIYTDVNTTGDGIMSALLLASVIRQSNKSLSENAKGFVRYPQVLINVTVDMDRKLCYRTNEEVQNMVHRLEAKYKGDGRILLRHSGTEPKVRVMIEGSNEEQIRKDAISLAECIERISK